MFYYLLKLNVELYKRNKKIRTLISIHSQYILLTYNLKFSKNVKNFLYTYLINLKNFGEP